MYFTYEGYRLDSTQKASRELVHHGYSMYEVKRILEEGYDCSASRRKANIRERCIRRAGKEIKAVVALVTLPYSDGYTETVWKLIHFGLVTYKRRKKNARYLESRARM